MERGQTEKYVDIFLLMLRATVDGIGAELSKAEESLTATILLKIFHEIWISEIVPDGEAGEKRGGGLSVRNN